MLVILIVICHREIGPSLHFNEHEAKFISIQCFLQAVIHSMFPIMKVAPSPLTDNTSLNEERAWLRAHDDEFMIGATEFSEHFSNIYLRFP